MKGCLALIQIKILFHFLYLPSYALRREYFVLSFLFFEVKAQLYFVNSSYMFLDEKTLLKFGLIVGET